MKEGESTVLCQNHLTPSREEGRGGASPGLINAKKSERHKRKTKRTTIFFKKIPPHNNTIYLNCSSYFSYQWYDFAGVPFLIPELWGWQLAKGKPAQAQHGQVYQRSLNGYFLFLSPASKLPDGGRLPLKLAVISFRDRPYLRQHVACW